MSTAVDQTRITGAMESSLSSPPLLSSRFSPLSPPLCNGISPSAGKYGMQKPSDQDQQAMVYHPNRKNKMSSERAVKKSGMRRKKANGQELDIIFAT